MLKRPALSLTLCALTVAGTVGALRAADTPQRPKGTDVTFADKFAGAGATEIALAKIALQKSKNSVVLSFANKMIADHTKADDKLDAIAAAQTFPLPQVTSDQLARLESQLSAASSPKAFDALYKADNVLGHNQALTILKTEIASGKDSALVAYAKAMLPTVQAHVRLAQALP